MVRQSRVRLPPQVDGAVKGTLTLRVGQPAWECPPPHPASVVLAVRWWGDAGPGDALEPGDAVQFQLCSGPKYIARYLQDLASLVLVAKQPPAAPGAGALRASGSTGAASAAATAVVGTISVDVRPLAAGSPLSGVYALVGEIGRVVGRVPVSLELAFSTAVVSSFEIHEAAAEAAASAADAGQQPGETSNAAGQAATGLAMSPECGSSAPSGHASPGEAVLRCPATCRQLEEALTEGTAEAALGHLGLSSKVISLSRSDAGRLVRQLLPGASEGAVSYATTALYMGQAAGCSGGRAEDEEAGLSIAELTDAVRECANVERSLAEGPGTVARQLGPLVSLLAGQHLEVSKAFAAAGPDREQEIGYPQLVSMLRVLSANASPFELRCLVAALAGADEAGAGRVSLPGLRRVLLGFSYAQAYPNEEEVRRQQEAAAARRQKEAAAASPAPTPAGRQGALGKLRSTLGQSRRGQGRGEQVPEGQAGPGAAADMAAACFPVVPAATAASFLAAAPETAAQPAGLTAGSVAAGGLAVGIPAGLPTAPLPQQLVPTTQAYSQLQQGLVALGVPIEQPVPAQPPPPQLGQQLAPRQLAQQPSTLPTLPASDPLQALISRAEQLQQAMSRAALNPALGAGLPSTLGLAVQPLPAAGHLPSLHSFNSLLPAPWGSAAMGTVAAAPGQLPLADVDLGPPDGAGSSIAGALWGSQGGQSDEGHLSAASLALIEAAKALAGPQQQAQHASTSSATPPAAAAADPAASLPISSSGGSGGGSSGLELALQHPITSAVAGPLAAEPELSWEDPTELAEDIILQELFFQPRKANSSGADSALDGPGTGSGLGARGPGQDQQQQPPVEGEGPASVEQRQVQAQRPAPPELVLSLRFATLRLRQQLAPGEPGSAAEAAAGATDSQPLASRAARVRGVVKSLHPSAQPTHFTLAVDSTSSTTTSSTSSSSSDGGRGPAGGPRFEAQQGAQAVAELEVVVPAACMEQGRLPSTLFIEVWDQAGAKLMGIVRAPLSVCHLPAAPNTAHKGPGAGADASASAGDLPAVVCEGRWDVWNVLEGRAEGSVEVFALVQERGQPRLVPAVRHGFSVTIQTAYRLPGGAAYAEAELQPPDARYVQYSFPGEPEPLFTKDVPVMANPTFDATAHHTITLPPDQDIGPVLAASGGRRLRFEVWDQWVDGRQQLHVWAELPMTELGGLVSAAGIAGEGSTGGDGGSAAQQSRLLPLVTDFDDLALGMGGSSGGAAGVSQAAAAAATVKGPALRVDLAYCAERVLVPAPPRALEVLEPVARRDSSQAALPRVLAPAVRLAAKGVEPQGLPHSANDSSGSVETLSKRQPQVAPPAAATAAPKVPSRRQQGRGEEEGGSGEENDVLLANCSPVKSVLVAAPAAVKGVEALICVEIIRACGLAAAVKEACAFSSGSTALNRARQVGAHPFARLALFPSDTVLQRRAPPLQTPFQAQTFCPEFHARHEYRLRLDGRMLAALAEQELLVELWHHLPRAQAVASALSSGRSSLAAAGAGPESGRAGGEREVFLGSASGPLLEVLRRPQGSRGWLGLKSRRGEAVGAVQVAVRLSELQGQPVFASAPDRSPLQQCRGALAGVLPPQLVWLLQDPEEAEMVAFWGQQATATVALEEIMPPQEEPSGREADRPKAELYFASYRLPGAAWSHTTAARTLTAGAGRGPAATGVAAAALAGRGWSAKLGHVGSFQVTAGPALRKALASFPLTVAVYKQPSVSAAGARHGRSCAPAGPVYVGTGEVDLAGLLWPRHSQGSNVVRSVSGSFPLVDPSAKSLGGARVRLKVTLDLEGASGQRQQGRAPAAAAAAAAGAAADVLEAAWEMEGEEEEGDVPQQQQQQQRRRRRQAPRASQQLQEQSHCSSDINEGGQERGGGFSQSLAAPARHEAESCGSAEKAPPPPSQPSPCSRPQPLPAGRPGSASLVTHGTGAGGSGRTAGQGPASAGGTDQAASAGVHPFHGASTGSSLGTGSRSGAPSPSPQLSPQPPSPAALQPSGSLLVHIESAVHLPSARPTSAAALRRPRSGGSDASSSGGGGGRSEDSVGGCEGGYNAYVCVAWGPQKQKYSTAEAAVQGLGSSSGGRANWDQVLELPAAPALFSPSTAGIAGISSSGGASMGDAQGPKASSAGLLLLLNLWSSPATSLGGAPGGSRVASPLPPQSAGAGHALIGCAAVDLATLPLLGEVAGYFNVVDYLQQVKGQLRVTARPDEALRLQLQAARGQGPAAVAAAGAAAGAPVPQWQGGRVDGGSPAPAVAQQAAGSSPPAPQPAASPATLAAAAEDHQEEQEEEEGAQQGSEALLGELQARVQALQLLSQRLTRAPTAAAEAPGSVDAASQAALAERPQLGDTLISAAAPVAACSAASSSIGSDREDEGHAAAGTHPGVLHIRPIEMSDEEEGGAGFLGQHGRGARGAWTDSEEDDFDLLGIAVEGAVSPGASSDEEPQRQPARPRQPALLAQDWMFDISVRPPSPAAPAASHGAPPAQQAQQAGAAAALGEGPAEPRRVSFQNVLLPGVVPPQPAGEGAGAVALAQQLQPAALEPIDTSGYDEEEDEGGAAVPSSQRPLPAMPEQPGPASSRAPAGDEASAAPGRGALLGVGLGITSHGLTDDWLFDISKRPPAGAASRAGAAGTAGRAPPISPYHQYLTLQAGNPSAALSGAGDGETGGTGPVQEAP